MTFDRVLQQTIGTTTTSTTTVVVLGIGVLILAWLCLRDNDPRRKNDKTQLAAFLRNNGRWSDDCRDAASLLH